MNFGPKFGLAMCQVRWEFHLLKSSESLKWNPLKSSKEMQAADERPRSKIEIHIQAFPLETKTRHLGPGGCLVNLEFEFLRQRRCTTSRLSPISQIMSRPEWKIFIILC